MFLLNVFYGLGWNKATLSSSTGQWVRCAWLHTSLAASCTWHNYSSLICFLSLAISGMGPSDAELNLRTNLGEFLVSMSALLWRYWRVQSNTCALVELRLVKRRSSKAAFIRINCLAAFLGRRIALLLVSRFTSGLGYNGYVTLGVLTLIETLREDGTKLIVHVKRNSSVMYCMHCWSIYRK